MKKILILVMIASTLTGCLTLRPASDYRVEKDYIVYDNGYYRPFDYYNGSIIFGPWNRYYGDYLTWYPRWDWYYNGNGWYNNRPTVRYNPVSRPSRAGTTVRRRSTVTRYSAPSGRRGSSASRSTGGRSSSSGGARKATTKRN